jgi:hypothetical protein
MTRSVATPILFKEGGWATGETITSPESSKLMKPRSKRWSIVGVNKSPFSPLSRSSLLESRQGLQWLARKWIGFVTPQKSTSPLPTETTWPMVRCRSTIKSSRKEMWSFSETCSLLVFQHATGSRLKPYREGQEDQLGALGLVVNVIALWNTTTGMRCWSNFEAKDIP